MDDLRKLQIEDIYGDESYTAKINELSFLDIYCMIDSKYRLPYQRIGNYGFAFDTTNKNATTTNGEIYIPAELSEVVMIELMGEFAFPAQYTGSAGNNLSLYYHNEVVMSMRTLDSHGYCGANHDRFMFRCKIVNNTARPMLLKPVSNSPNDSCRIIFRTPVNISRLEFAFRLPNEMWQPDDDILTVTIAYTNPVELTVVSTALLSGSDGHRFTTASDAISFIDFDSTTPDYRKADINSITGPDRTYLVTVIDPNTFTIPLDFTGAIATDPQRPTRINIYVESRRIRFPLRFRRLHNFTTNKLVGVM